MIGLTGFLNCNGNFNKNLPAEFYPSLREGGRRPGEVELKPQRTLPPAASPIGFIDIAHGIAALRHGEKTRERFKSELQQYFGVKHVFLVSSGKAALFCILKALQKLHPDRNEVLVPAFNCYSVPSAVLAAGLKIRLCDIDPNTLDFGPREAV